MKTKPITLAHNKNQNKEKYIPVIHTTNVWTVQINKQFMYPYFGTLLKYPKKIKYRINEHIH